MIDFGGSCEFWHCKRLIFNRDTHVVAAGEGQRVRLDRSNAVIFTMPWLDKVQAVGGGTLVHANAGVVMMRVRGREREVVPNSLLLLQQVWNVSKCEATIDEVCVVCGTAGDIFTCPLCMMTVHEQCQVQHCSFPSMAIAPMALIPGHFKLCSARIAKDEHDNAARRRRGSRRP